MLEDKLEV